MIEKVADIKAKTNLQPSFIVGRIDSKCPKGYYLLIKRKKEDANWEHRNEAFSNNKKKAKSYNPFSANQSQA